MPLGTTVKGVKVDYPALVPAYVSSTSHPTSYPPGGILIESNTGDIKRNVGTLNSPSFTSIVSSATTDASDSAKGVTKLSVAPASPTNPIALGANDPLLTTTSNHLSNTSNPHNVTAAQLGAALDVDFDAHVSNRVPHINVGTLAERDAAPSPTNGEAWLVTDEGRWYWRESGAWSTAPSSPAVSYDDLTDVPAVFPPELHAGTHATGQADEISPASIGAPPATRTILTTSGQLTGGGDLSGDRTLGLATIPGLVPDTYGIGGGSATVDAYGRVTAITPGTTSGVPFATAAEGGVVYLNRDPVGAETATALLYADYSPGITTSRQVLTTGALSGGGDLSSDRTITLNALGVTAAYIANSTITVDKIISGGSFIRSVADSTARNALGAIREGQVVHQKDNNTSYQSNSADGTDAASVTWTALGGLAQAAYDMPFVFADAATVRESPAHVIHGSNRIIGRVRAFNKGTAPSGANLIAEVRKNGTLVTGGTITITAGNTSANLSDLNISCADGDRITVAITQIGSTSPGNTVTYSVEIKVT